MMGTPFYFLLLGKMCEKIETFTQSYNIVIFIVFGLQLPFIV